MKVRVLAQWMSREDMRSLYNQADAFVLATRGEGWGLPIMEAMSMALPVLVTDCSGVTEYASETTALLVKATPNPNPSPSSHAPHCLSRPRTVTMGSQNLIKPI